jgi:hypothetical protein
VLFCHFIDGFDPVFDGFDQLEKVVEVLSALKTNLPPLLAKVPIFYFLKKKDFFGIVAIPYTCL